MENVPNTSSTKKARTKKQKIIAGILIGLLSIVAVGGVAYGVYTWQQSKIDSINTSQRAEVEKLNTTNADLQTSNEALTSQVSTLEASSAKQKTTAANAVYQLKIADVNKALPNGCSLTAKSASDLRVMTVGTVAGELSESESGRINKAKSWIFATVFCDGEFTNTMPSLLTRLADNSWIVVDTTWSTVPVCGEPVDRSGVPREVISKCIEEDNNDKIRTIEAR